MKTEKQKLIAELDKLWSLTIRTRDRFHCQMGECPAKGIRMHAAHIWSRNNKSIRWDINNGVTLCYYHHIFWTHRNPIEFAEWARKRLGKKKFYALRDKANKDLKEITIESMKKTRIKLKRQLKYYQDANEKELF